MALMELVAFKEVDFSVRLPVDQIGVAGKIAAKTRIPYAGLTGMPISTAESHQGEVVLGTLAGKSVVAFSGRLHGYEGHSPEDVVVPVRLVVMAQQSR